MALTSLVPGFRRASLPIPLPLPMRSLERFFDDWFDTDSELAERFDGKNLWCPRIDVTESEREVVVSAEMPGLDEKSIEVELAGDRLTIQGEKQEETKEEKPNYFCQERRYGMFRRELTMPVEVDAAKVKATYRKGVLRVVLPKTAEAQKKSRHIKIES